MGQKVHPKSIRLKVIYGWQSNWFASPADFALYVKEDDAIRKFIHSTLKAAAISRVEIDRKAKKLILRIITGRPGIVVGRGGQGLDTLRKQLAKVVGHSDIQLDVLEVDKIDAEAQLVAESIAQQLERRVTFRRAMKQSIQRAQRAGIKGIKISVSGRLGGAEIARTEDMKDGTVPLHTFRADIDYGFCEAKTVFGIIGVKVWICKGEVLPGQKPEANIKARVGGGRNDGPQGGLRGGSEQGGGRGGNEGRRGKTRRSGPVTTRTETASANEPSADNTPASESTES